MRNYSNVIEVKEDFRVNFVKTVHSEVQQQLRETNYISFIYLKCLMKYIASKTNFQEKVWA